MAPRKENNLQIIKRISQNVTHELERPEDNSVESGAQAILFSKWSEILRAAPIAIGCLGECSVAVSHPKSASIELNVVGSPQYKHVRSNLMECVHIGRDAFQEAQSQMNRVQISARYICESRGLLEKVMGALEFPELIVTAVPRYLKQVEDMSKKCEDGTRIVDEKFKDWLEKAQRIHQACKESEQSTESKKSTNEIDLGIAERTQRRWAEVTKTTEKEKNMAERDVNKWKDETEKAYDKTKYRARDLIIDGLAEMVEFGKEVTREGFELAKEVAKGLPYMNGGFPIPVPVRSKSESKNSGPAGGTRYPQPQISQGTVPISSVLLSIIVQSQFEILCGTPIIDLVSKHTPQLSKLLDEVINGLQMHLSQYALAQSTDELVVSLRKSLSTAVTVGTSRLLFKVCMELIVCPYESMKIDNIDHLLDYIVQLV